MECPICGSQYIITSERIDRIDRGPIRCHVCDIALLEYDGCVSYYPYMVTSKFDHLKDADKLGGLAAGGVSDVTE